MNLDAARALKKSLQMEFIEAQEGAANTRETPAGRFLRPLVEAHGRRAPLTGAQLQTELSLATPALGISSFKGEYGLAVRVQAVDTRPYSLLLEYLSERASFAVDLRTVAYARAYTVGTGRYRPVVPGVSIGNVCGTTGTLGCFVTRNDGRTVEGLSTNHVLANCNRASVGDEVLQPGSADGGSSPSDAVGAVSHFQPLIRPPDVNSCDAALVEFAEEVANSVSLVSIATPNPDDDVRKLGRTTAMTSGSVTAIELDGLNLDIPGFGIATFDGLFEVEGVDVPFSRSGDSGAVVTDSAGEQGYGMVLGGDGSTTWAAPLSTTLTVLGATLLT